MASNRPPRKEIMSLRPAQWKIVTMVCLPPVFACVIVSFVQTYFFLSSLRSKQVLDSDLSQEIIPLSILIAAIALLVMVPVFVLLAVWVSHRIVGPLRRFARELQAVGEGHLDGKFTVRQGDDLAFLGTALTEMKERLKERLKACRSAADQVGEAARKVESSVRNNGSAELRAASGELSSAVSALRSRLEAFAVSAEAAQAAGAPAADLKAGDK